MPAIPPPPSFLLLTHTQIFKNRETNTNTHYLSLSLSLSLSLTRGEEIGGLRIVPCTLGFLGSPKLGLY
jgi:hypothetical protein